MYDTHSGRKLKQTIDWKLVVCYLLLVLVGWMNIYASVHSVDSPSIFDWSLRSGKQFVWMLTAFALAALICFTISPKLWDSGAIPVFYVGVFLLLIAVIFMGKEVNGSKSWFSFGPISFQPAEISKITTSLILSFIMSKDSFKLSKAKDFMVIALLLGLPFLAILAEQETGSALVYLGFVFVLYREGLSGWWLAAIGLCILLFILTLTKSAYCSIMVLLGILAFLNFLNAGRPWIVMLCTIPVYVLLAFIPKLLGLLWQEEGSGLFSGTDPVYLLLGICVMGICFLLYWLFRHRWRFLLMSVIAFLAGAVLVLSTDYIFNNIMEGYQRARIEDWLGIKKDPMGVGYNVNQSMIAIGSGGFIGKGYLHGTQTAYGFVPEQSTDFIFCTIGEEWGFRGCFFVIALYVLFIWWIVGDAEKSRQKFTRIYGYCVASCLFMHLVINIGMTIGLMPVIGIPLPLISYGGSSLWAFTVMIFIFIALYRDEKKYF